jgi:hypothetical protein
MAFVTCFVEVVLMILDNDARQKSPATYFFVMAVFVSVGILTSFLCVNNLLVWYNWE